MPCPQHPKAQHNHCNGTQRHHNQHEDEDGIVPAEEVGRPEQLFAAIADQKKAANIHSFVVICAIGIGMDWSAFAPGMQKSCQNSLIRSSEKMYQHWDEPGQ